MTSVSLNLNLSAPSCFCLHFSDHVMILSIQSTWKQRYALQDLFSADRQGIPQCRDDHSQVTHLVRTIRKQESPRKNWIFRGENMVHPGKHRKVGKYHNFRQLDCFCFGEYMLIFVQINVEKFRLKIPGRRFPSFWNDFVHFWI